MSFATFMAAFSILTSLSIAVVMASLPTTVVTAAFISALAIPLLLRRWGIPRRDRSCDMGGALRRRRLHGYMRRHEMSRNLSRAMQSGAWDVTYLLADHKAHQTAGQEERRDGASIDAV